MMRVCNLDTCPMGICTQNPELRKNFKGKPEYIINYLTFVAEELREYMAKLGGRTIDELVGRTDLLKVKPAAPGSRASKMDLDCILHNPAIENSNVHFVKEDTYDFHLENTLDMKVLMKKFKLSSKNAQSVTLDVSNTDRAFGAIFGSEITRKYGNSLPDDVYTARPRASRSSPRRTLSPATWPCTVLPAARRSFPAWPVSASPCATAVPPPLWRALATTAANT